MHNKMKYISVLSASLLGMLALTTSCNDEWKDEQYSHYISFSAPLTENGVTEINVPYTRRNYDANGNLLGNMFATDGQSGEGLSEYNLPVIVSGSNNNDRNLDIHFEADLDTLDVINTARFQLRKDLYYHPIRTDKEKADAAAQGETITSNASYPDHLQINKGQNVGLLNIRFDFNGLDLVDKWVLPIKILDKTDNDNFDYISHPRKHYAKAMLRVFPFNDWSGLYSGTNQKIFITGDDANASACETVRFYVVSENQVFFYPGLIDEDRQDRKNYKIYATFEGGNNGIVRFHCDNPAVKFKTNKDASYRVIEERDAVKDYLLHRYVIINNIDYEFVDYTSIKGYEMPYSVQGTLTLDRIINTQEPDKDYAIQW